MTADGTSFIVPRTLPHNIEAEQAVLGAILVNNEAAERVADVLGACDFFDPLHAAIYDTTAKLIQFGKPANPVTLKTFFDDTPPAGAVPVAVYMARLARDAASIGTIAGYAQAVHDLASRRRMIAVAGAMVEAAHDATTATAETISAAADDLHALTEHAPRQQEFTAAEAAQTAVAAILAAYEAGGGLVGLSTGMKGLDAKLGGMDAGNLIVIAGAPGMGKTSLALGIAQSLAMGSTPVGFFSQEMSESELMMRVIADQSGIDAEAMRTGRIDQAAAESIVRGSAGFAGLPLIIDTTGGLTLARVAAKARRMARRHHVRALVIDYLQLMHGAAGATAFNRNQQIGEITTGLKALAKDLALPILLLSQINREAPKRENKRPQLSDLRDSGSIEQDADAVIFVHRPEYYLMQAKPDEGDAAKMAEWSTALMVAKGLAELIVAKNRHGRTGTVLARFTGTSFVEG